MDDTTVSSDDCSDKVEDSIISSDEAIVPSNDWINKVEDSMISSEEIIDKADDAIVSSSTGETVALISVTIYSQKNESLLGIWSGVLNLSKFYTKLQSLSLPYDIRVIYTDGNGQKIGDSNSLLSNKSESFVELNSFKNGKSGKAGNGSETINGTKFLVSYAPVSILSKTWVVMVITNLG